MRANRRRYLASIADEVHSQSKRVRDLIGDRHWYSDGHQKEYLLASVLERHIPGAMVAARGFLVSPNDQAQCSSEQDILIVDTTQEAPIFNQGGLVVVFPRNLRAAISVKTKLGAKELRESVKGLNSVRSVAAASGVDSSAISCSAYFFEDSEPRDPTDHYKTIKAAIQEHKPATLHVGQPDRDALGPNVLAGARDLLYRLDYVTQTGPEC